MREDFIDAWCTYSSECTCRKDGSEEYLLLARRKRFFVLCSLSSLQHCNSLFIIGGTESSSCSKPLSPSLFFLLPLSTVSSAIKGHLILTHWSVLRVLTRISQTALQDQYSQRGSCYVFREKWFKLLQTNVWCFFSSQPLLDILLAAFASRPAWLCWLFPICAVTAMSHIRHSTRWYSLGNSEAAGREMRPYWMVHNTKKGKTHTGLVPYRDTVTHEDWTQQVCMKQIY